MRHLASTTLASTLTLAAIAAWAPIWVWALTAGLLALVAVVALLAALFVPSATAGYDRIIPALPTATATLVGMSIWGATELATAAQTPSAHR